MLMPTYSSDTDSHRAHGVPELSKQEKRTRRTSPASHMAPNPARILRCHPHHITTMPTP